VNRLLLTYLTLAAATACSSTSTSSETADALLLDAAIEACAAAADAEGRRCERDCERLMDEVALATCTTACTLTRNERASSCDAVDDVGILACDDPSSCLADLEHCRDDAAEAGAACEATCGADPLALRCQLDCDARRAADEASCAFVAARTSAPATEIPELPVGRPADLALLLDDEEIAVVEAADVRAEALRKRDLRLFVGAPDVAVTITQLSHGFEFGFPVDFREFRDEPEDLEFYGQIARDHASLMVAETALKWRQLEPEPGRLEFDLGDSELAWADENGFRVKMHTLLWGNAPPLSTGSGTPDWLRARFPDNDLSESEQQELRDLIRFQAESIVERYRGRIDIYDITNEMLNPITGWFSERLGQRITDDLFRWVRAIDPGAQLVMNEWISEVFTDFGGADAESVRDRVFELQAAGVPIDAIGIQAHFAPVTVFVGEPTLDDPRLERRTRIDDYAEALAVLSEPGLPLHMTETTFNTPADGERRAAQAEAIMRLWWGTESVEEIVFWSLWNKVAARNQLQHGVFDDTRNGTLTRHGEAIVSLMNDRWRTVETATTDAAGAVELRATLGDYVATWDTPDGPQEVRFRVEKGPGVLRIAAVGGAPPSE
jgi:GH35 family endo-1,4-beta-xylanase